MNRDHNNTQIKCPGCGVVFRKPQYSGHVRDTNCTTYEQRFWAKIDTTGECWLWTGFLNHDGYGRAAPLHGVHRGKRAHRLAWELTYGPIPAGMYLMHKCDVRACCNPVHLRLGTQQDNISDMKAKGRGPTGAAQITRRKLTDDQVRYIRVNYRKTGPRTGNGSELARQMGISPGMVHRIGRGDNWKHIK